MADYDPPTAEDLIGRFPEFEDTSEDLIVAALAEALRQVDKSWTAGDYRIAVTLLAAHLISVTEAGDSGLLVASQSIGPFSESYFKSDRGWTSGSPYGERYLTMLRRNKPAILVV